MNVALKESAVRTDHVSARKDLPVTIAPNQYA